MSVRLWLATLLMLSGPVGVASGQAASTEPGRPDRIRSLWIDSTRVTITVGERRAVLAVATPVGRYHLTTDSAALAAWASAAAKLGAPRPGDGGALQYDGIVLRHPTQSDAMRLVRLTADSAPDYQFNVSNGGWGHAFLVRAAVAESLLAALRGEPADHGPGEPMPQEAVWYEFQVEEPAVPQRRGPTPKYPEALRQAHVEGRVILQFIVGPDGVPRPSSRVVIESSHPEFTRAVGEAVLSMRFRPARRSGAMVAQYVQQPFEFRIR